MQTLPFKMHLERAGKGIPQAVKMRMLVPEHHQRILRTRERKRRSAGGPLSRLVIDVILPTRPCEPDFRTSRPLDAGEGRFMMLQPALEVRNQRAPIHL